MRHRLLVVDDENLFLNLTRSLLEKEGYQVDTARSGVEAIEKIRQYPFQYSLIILDFKMDEKSGLDTTKELLSINSDLYILMYSVDETRDALHASFRCGVVDFIAKNGDEAELLAQVKNWCQKYEHTHLTISVAGCQSEHSKLITSVGMIGRSDALAMVAKKIVIFRDKRSHVLVTGESGVGKEKVAEALHTGSKHLLKVVNGASYNSPDPTLMEAELFGAKKGSYTGADRDRKGIFEDANGGTVFFDEIHTLSLAAQEKLLRVLQKKVVRPLGETTEYSVNFRLVAASKADIEERKENGLFREDLYYRLNVLRIDIPPLRERKEDIEPLVAHFCQKYTKQNNVRKSFLARTVRYMERYHWPGNIRELESMVERLCTETGDTEKIGPEHLPPLFFDGPVVENGVSPMALQTRLEQIKKENVEAALKASRGKQREAARRLGMPPSSFHDLLKRFNLLVAKSPRKRGNAGRELGR